MVKFQFKKIREFRETEGLTQHALGELIGLFPQQISAWETEEQPNITVRNLLKLCEALHREPNDFFVEEEN